MRAPTGTTGHANRDVRVPVDELEGWARSLTLLEDALAHARDDTTEGCPGLAGPGRDARQDLAWALTPLVIRMRELAEVRPVTPQRDDGATMPCPACATPFVPSGRRRYCSDACRGAAWRRRHGPAPVPVVLPPSLPRRAVTVYECPSCEARLLAEQRCGDCGVFSRRAGLGGCCPHCDEPVTLAELVGEGVVATDDRRRR